jgi:hypothetical protein
MMRRLVIATLCVGVSGCASDKEVLKAGFYQQREKVNLEHQQCNSRFPDQPGYFRQRTGCRLDATEKLGPYLPDDVNDMLAECRDEQLALADEADDGQVPQSDYHKRIEALKDQCIASMNKDGRITRWKQQSPDPR